MRWFSRRSTSNGRHSVSSAAAPAMAAVTSPASAAGSVSPVPSMGVPTGLERFVPPPGSGVYLGFADGVVLQLDAEDPRARTFRALARSLAQGAQ